jgi:hypothetical protein
MSRQVDAEIIASLGSLPADRAVLEQERRSRFVARVRAILEQPDGFTDASLTPWLRQVGVASVGELLTRFRGVIHAGGVRVAFAPPAAVEPFPMALPLTAAILIRDIGMSVSRLLVESKLVRDQLASHGLERPHDPGLRPRATPLIVWAVPAETFDDADWPGGTDEMDAAARRLARRDAASQWLGREGIGVVAID